MRFRITHTIHVTEHVIQCAIAEILESNKVRHLGNYAEIKLNDKNILAQIKERVWDYGENGLDDCWYNCFGTNVWHEAGALVSEYTHLVD